MGKDYTKKAKQLICKNRRLHYFEGVYAKKYGKAEWEAVLGDAVKTAADYMPTMERLPRGERLHVKLLLPIAALHIAFRSRHPDTALSLTREAMLASCEGGGRFFRGVSAVRLGRALFMRASPFVLERGFGETNGFCQEILEVSNRRIRFDITQCPYCKHINALGAGEVMPVFCESDIIAYGNMHQIRFERTSTLGMGGKQCDFALTRTDFSTKNDKERKL